MKKLLAIIVLSFNLSTPTQALTMKGIDEVEIIIEKNNRESAKVCNINERDVKTALEYIVTNSRIKIGTNKNSSKILIDFVEVAKGIEKVFKTYKPNVVFVPNGLSNIDVTIIESLSKFYKVKFLTPETFRYKNFFYFCDNLENETLQIKKNYLKVKKKFKNNEKINKIFNKLTSKKNYVSVDAKETKRILETINKKKILETILGIKFYSILKHSFFFVLFS